MQNDRIKQRTMGQFFTITNPFATNAFVKWFKSIPHHEKCTILEPFAGCNNIVAMIQELGFNNDWVCYDIEPNNKDNVCEGYKIEKRDTLSEYPAGFSVAITNPPYLAKNSASRNNLEYPTSAEGYDDLYKYCLEVMLDNTEYVAAIVPESFITSSLFHNRLDIIIELVCRMFSDTECPVCLALFVPEERKSDRHDFDIYQNEMRVGSFLSLKSHKIKECGYGLKLDFNNPNGRIGIKCIDNSKNASIEFCKGDNISSDSIRSTSRHITRVDGPFDAYDIDKLVDACNVILNDYRDNTFDVFMTAFKGLRSDGRYRRRLDFKTAKDIIGMAMEQVGERIDFVS